MEISPYIITFIEPAHQQQDKNLVSAMTADVFTFNVVWEHDKAMQNPVRADSQKCHLNRILNHTLWM